MKSVARGLRSLIVALSLLAGAHLARAGGVILVQFGAASTSKPPVPPLTEDEFEDFVNQTESKDWPILPRVRSAPAPDETVAPVIDGLQLVVRPARIAVEAAQPIEITFTLRNASDHDIKVCFLGSNEKDFFVRRGAPLTAYGTVLKPGNGMVPNSNLEMGAQPFILHPRQSTSARLRVNQVNDLTMTGSYDLLFGCSDDAALYSNPVQVDVYPPGGLPEKQSPPSSLQPQGYHPAVLGTFGLTQSRYEPIVLKHDNEQFFEDDKSLACMSDLLVYGLTKTTEGGLASASVTLSTHPGHAVAVVGGRLEPVYRQTAYLDLDGDCVFDVMREDGPRSSDNFILYHNAWIPVEGSFFGFPLDRPVTSRDGKSQYVFRGHAWEIVSK